MTDDGALPRLGFLGLGWIGRHRMEAIHASGAASVSALCDPSAEMLEAAAAIAPEAALCADLDEMLDLPLDGIVIATPSAGHAAQSIKALERGMAVFCQKPLGRNAGEVAEVVRVARQQDRLLGLDLSYRQTAAASLIRDMIADGSIGEVYSADLTFHNAYGPDKPWFYNLEQSGGGCVMDLGIHLVDMLLWTLNLQGPLEVSSNLFNQGVLMKRGDEAVEDYALATLNMGNGLIARLACSWKLNAGCVAEIGAVFHGTRGALAFHNVNGSFYDFSAELLEATNRRILVSPPDNWGGRGIVAWAKQLQESNGFSPAADRFIHTARTLDRIYGRDIGVHEKKSHHRQAAAPAG